MQNGAGTVRVSALHKPLSGHQAAAAVGPFGGSIDYARPDFDFRRPSSTAMIVFLPSLPGGEASFA
jgi:hypothetical protein